VVASRLSGSGASTTWVTKLELRDQKKAGSIMCPTRTPGACAKRSWGASSGGRKGRV